MSAIRFEAVSKTFKSDLGAKPVQALEELTLDIRPGEIFGFLGPNGAGKSTAIKILMNLIRADSGTVSILDMSANNKDSRKRVGFLPENPFFYDYLNAEELLWFGGRTSGLSRERIREQSDLLLRRVNLQGARTRPLRSYSKGMVQRAGLALALVHDPDVVILDEPMSGLDPIGRKMVGDLLLELRSRNKTVFFSSHILTDVERFCDRAGIIVGGRLRLVGDLQHLLAGGITLEDVFLREVEKAGGGGDA